MHNTHSHNHTLTHAHMRAHARTHAHAHTQSTMQIKLIHTFATFYSLDKDYSKLVA